MELGGGTAPQKKKEPKGTHNADAKFDALFGGPAEEDNSNLEAMIMESLAPPEANKKSGHDNKNRKESNISGGPVVTRQQLPRVRFDKKVLLSRFKMTREINLSVFEQ